MPGTDRAHVRGGAAPRSPSLGQLVGLIEHRLRQRTELALAAAGLTLEQWRAIELLTDGTGHSMTEVAGHVMVPAPTLTKMVDRLAESGLVFRTTDARDRRRILVVLSDNGHMLHRMLAPEVLRAERELAAELGPVITELTRLLSSLSN